MAQSALTVTPPSPTPPTNMSCTGATPPNPPNYTKNTYEDYRPDTDFDTYPPPYFDDGAAGSLILFATNTSALASGSGDTAGGTGNPTNSTAGTAGSYPGAANGTVPASTSVAHEGAGTELAVTQTYSAGVYNPGGALIMVSCGPVLTAASIALGPNGSHASTLTPTYASNPTHTAAALTSAVSGTGTTTVTCTGTNFIPGCRIWVNNVEQTTTLASATSLTAVIQKKREAGTWQVDVKLGGVAVPSTRTVTWS